MNLLSVDALWLLGEEAAAESLGEWVEDVPASILQSKNPILKAVMVAFRAKQLLM